MKEQFAWHHSTAGERCIAFFETTDYSASTALSLEWIICKYKEVKFNHDTPVTENA